MHLWYTLFLPSRWVGATAANGCGIACGNCP